MAVVLLTVGCTRAAPPMTEAQLTSLFQAKSNKLQRLSEMVSSDPRLADLSRKQKSWEAVRRSGVADAQIVEYVELLRDIGANEELSGIYGLGKVTLIVADPWAPLPGANMAGFVFSPVTSRPIGVPAMVKTWH
jgi:hypothetical protein